MKTIFDLCDKDSDGLIRRRDFRSIGQEHFDEEQVRSHCCSDSSYTFYAYICLVIAFVGLIAFMGHVFPKLLLIYLEVINTLAS